MQQYLFCPRGPFCAFAHDDDEAQIVYDITDTQYPDTTSPPNSVSVSTDNQVPCLMVDPLTCSTQGIIGDKRSRAYTHSGLALEPRTRSGSNDSRMRSLSLIDSLQNMSVGSAPAHVTAPLAQPPLPAAASLPDSRNRSQSQGSGENTANLVPDHRESSPVLEL